MMPTHYQRSTPSLVLWQCLHHCKVMEGLLFWALENLKWIGGMGHPHHRQDPNQTSWYHCLSSSRVFHVTLGHIVQKPLGPFQEKVGEEPKILHWQKAKEASS